MRRRTFIKERMLFPLVLIMVMAALSVTFVSCMPELPTEDDIVITPPNPDPLPDDKEEEPEQPKAWVWHETGLYPESFAFEVSEDEIGVQLYVDGEKSRVIQDGDHFIIMSERVKVSAKKLDGEWKVYSDDTECGFFRYE